MTYKDCIEMKASLELVKQPNIADLKDMTDKMDYLFHQDFVIAVTKNKRQLSIVKEDLDAIIEPTEEFKKYSEERIKVLRKFGEKDENGNPLKRVIGAGQVQYTISNIDNNVPYNTAMNQLDEEHKEVLKFRDDQFEKYNLKLKDKADFKPEMIPERNIPKGLDMLAMDGVLFMIEFDKPKKK